MNTYNHNCVRKLAYDSRNDAKKSASARGKGLRPYKCPHCTLWHLSTKSKREVRIRKKTLHG